MSLQMYEVSRDYTAYLHRYDGRVMVEHPEAGNRKFIGVVLSVNGREYFAPMSSPKPKHERIPAGMPDIYKIGEGKYGVINLNNMIPVPLSCLSMVRFDEVPDEKYRSLLQRQLRLIKRDEAAIVKKAQKLHHRAMRQTLNESLKARCCDFLLLEERCRAYEEN